MTSGSMAFRQCLTISSRQSGAFITKRRPQQFAIQASMRRFESSKTTTYEQSDGKIHMVETTKPPTLKNLALASALLAFCGSVFAYSMNAVGKGEAELDPLAQLKAEAQEAREHGQNNRKLTPEEINALESGLTGEYDETSKLEVAVAAPAEIAQLEEEANLKVFRQKHGQEQPKKKCWWRFGF